MHAPGTIRKLIFPVGGMSCASCVSRVEKALQDVQGVVSVNVNLASEKATVEYTGDTDPAEIYRAVADAGYSFREESAGTDELAVTAQREISDIKNKFIISLCIAGAIMASAWSPFLTSPLNHIFSGLWPHRSNFGQACVFIKAHGAPSSIKQQT
jgi:Cu+-exporting ATPase